MSKQKFQTKMKSKTPGSRKRILLVALAAVLLMGGATGTYIYKSRSNSVETPEDRKPTINYEPATKEEKKQVEDTKDRIVKEQNDANNNGEQTGKKAVTPTITGTSGSIRAYVMGIFEEGGTCTATFTKDGVNITKTSVGFQNASYTQCAPIAINDGTLAPGTWSMQLSYSSSTAEGSSPAQNIEVN